MGRWIGWRLLASWAGCTAKGDSAVADYRTNADLIAEILHGAGVRYAAGIPSGQILALIDAMRKVGIDFVLTSHEGAAGVIARAIGRVTRGAGVAIAHLGPGAAHPAT